MDTTPAERSRRNRVGWCVGGALLAGVGIAMLVRAHPEPVPGEVGYVRALQRVGGPVPAAAEALWYVTGTEAALIVAGLPAVWLMVRQRARGLLAVLVAAATMLVVQPAAKDLVDRPRPSPDVVDVRAAHDSSSFPSGHVMSTTTVWASAAGFAWTRRRRVLALTCLAPITLTFVASGVLGVHWPTDAVGGLLFGATCATLIVVITRSGDTRSGEPG